MSFRSEDSWRSSAMSAGRMGRVIAQNSELEEEALARGLREHARLAARKLVTPESAFYRVLDEAKVYVIDMRAKSGAERGRNGDGSADDADQEIVSIMEMMKSAGRTSSRDRMHMQNDRNAYCVKKMPDEVVASSGRLRCPYGPTQQLTTFIQLAHIDNGYMILSMQQPKQRGSVSERLLLEKLPESDTPFQEMGRFYYRVLVPIELRRGPDLVAPIVSRQLFKNAEEIVECSERFRCPQSAVTFVKLAYEDGWLFETLNSGIRVLERLATEPEIEHGQFFYIVRIPVGIRVAPNIMAQRAGKGYRLHSIVEGSQRFTPPGSKITYVKVCREKSSRCTCSHSHQNHDIGLAGGSGSSPKARVRLELSEEEKTLIPRTSSTSSLIGTSSSSSCSGGWIFETTMDGQLVLEQIPKPIERQIERLFYRVLEDAEVLPTPGFFESSSSDDSQTDPWGAPASKRKRLKDTLVECSERIVPAISSVSSDVVSITPTTTASPPQLAFVKLRHDVGWICERQLQPPYRHVLEQVQGFAVTRDEPKFYRVLVPVYLRSAPDFECPRLPGVNPLAVGCVFESSLQYTPPGSRITYIKVSSDAAPASNSSASGWVFNQTPSDDKVVEAIDEDPEKKKGRFFFRVLCDKKEVLLSPERSGEVVKYLFENTFFAAEMEYTIPRSQETYVRLSKEKGWVLLDAQDAKDGKQTLQRLHEDLFNLYQMPPSWVSIGHPNRTWFKVPDETCRTILVEETLLQMQVFKARNILAASSQGRESVPLSRQGSVTLKDGTVVWPCVLEEIKHAASALLFTFPWKQVWWIFEMENGDKHSVELQHGLRGGFKSVLFDGEVQVQNRSVGDILWDAGSEFVFEWQNHTFKVVIALEGAFFSQYLQFYSYSLVVDDEEIVPIGF